MCSTKYRNIHAAHYCVLLFKVLNQHCMLQLVSSNAWFEIQNKFFFTAAVYQFQLALGIKISTISKWRKVPTPNHPESCSDFRCLLSWDQAESGRSKWLTFQAMLFGNVLKQCLLNKLDLSVRGSCILLILCILIVLHRWLQFMSLLMPD